MKSLIDIYQSVAEKLKPVPAKPHYVFNMKDLSRVVQGLQLVASKTKVKPKNVKKSKRLFLIKLKFHSNLFKTKRNQRFLAHHHQYKMQILYVYTAMSL